MVKIRLQRFGKKKHPIYRIVAADKRSPRDGAYVESVGSYDPNQKPAMIAIRETRAEYWLKNGAQPTDTVRSLFRRTGFWMRWSLKKQGKDQETITKLMERWQMAQNEKAQREADRKARRASKKKAAAAPAETAAAPAPAPEAPSAA